MQKIAVIGPNLAIAWAGNVDKARHLLTALRDANNVEARDYRFLSGYLDNEAACVINDEVQLIGLVHEGGSWRIFSRHVRTYQDEQVGLVLASGSGGGALILQLRNILHRPELRESPLFGVISTGAALAGTLLTHERAHLDSLQSLYGGAYEILTSDGRTCRKVGDLLYVYWIAEVEAESIRIRVLSQVSHYQYWNDILVVRTVTLQGMKAGVNGIDDSYTLIPTAFRELTAADMKGAPIPSLDAEVVAHIIACRAQDGEVYTVARVDFGNKAAFHISEEQCNGGTSHSISAQVAPDFIDRTCMEMKRLLPSSK